MSASNFSPVTHVIFDVDGLLLDTETLYTTAINCVIAPFNKDFPWDLKVRCMGMKGDLATKLIVDELQLPFTYTEYTQKVHQQYDLIFSTAALLPGAERLVRHLSSHGVPIALASGGSSSNFALKTTNHGPLFSLFSHAVFASSDPEVSLGKPSPQVFQVCAARFKDKPAPQKCLVFEDAPNGVTASLAARMQVVMVPDARLDRRMTDGATLLLGSLQHFKPELFGLPPFE